MRFYTKIVLPFDSSLSTFPISLLCIFISIAIYMYIYIHFAPSSICLSFNSRVWWCPVGQCTAKGQEYIHVFIHKWTDIHYICMYVCIICYVNVYSSLSVDNTQTLLLGRTRGSDERGKKEDTRTGISRSCSCSNSVTRAIGLIKLIELMTECQWNF